MTFQQIIQLPNKLGTTFKLLTSRFNKIGDKIKNYEMPEKIKNTFFERWAKYWHNLYIDYKDVAIDVIKDCKEHPLRATIYTTRNCFYFNRHNPDESVFREQLIQNSLKLMQVGEPIRNPVSVHHVKWLEQCYNEGIIRRINLGVFSLIWLDNYDKHCSLYKAACPYLKPQYTSFHKRIVDIGFLDQWWLLERQMKNYDVNEDSFDIQITNNVNTVSTL